MLDRYTSTMDLMVKERKAQVRLRIIYFSEEIKSKRFMGRLSHRFFAAECLKDAGTL